MPSRSPAASHRASSHIRREACIDCTYACNLKCVHCNVSCMAESAVPELSTAEFIALFDQLKAAGVTRATLTGGEAILRADWETILRESCARFETTLFTNAIAVTTQMAATLHSMRIAIVEVSVYGATAKVYESVTGVEGSFARFKQGLANLRDASLRVVPKSMLLRQNIEQWRQLRDEYGACKGFKWDFRVTPRFDGGSDPVGHRATDRQVYDFLCGTGVPRHRKRHKGRALSEAICGAASTGCVVSAHGDILPCGLLPMAGGNIRNKPFSEIWESEVFQRIRQMHLKDLTQCASCAAIRYCRPCPARNYLERGDLCLPSPDSCRSARMRQMVAEMGLDAPEEGAPCPGEPDHL